MIFGQEVTVVEVDSIQIQKLYVKMVQPVIGPLGMLEASVSLVAISPT